MKRELTGPQKPRTPGERTRLRSAPRAPASGLASALALVREFARAEEGQATVEYILLLSVVAVAAAGIARAIIGALDKGVLVFGGALEKSLKTGRAPINVWTN